MTSVHEALDQAVSLHRAGDLQQAEAIYRQILAADPRNADAWHLLGLVAHARGDGPAAVQCISRAIVADGGQPSFHLHLAEVHRTLGNLELAEQSCRQALRLKPDFATAHNTLGVLQNAQSRHAEAVASFRRAIELEPGLAVAHGNLGATLHLLGDSAAGIGACRQALALDPMAVEVALDLVKILRDTGDISSAKDVAQQALAIAPASAEAEFQLGTIAQLQNRADEAASRYQRAVQLDPRHGPAWCNLGTVLREQHKLNEAFAAFQHAAECDPQLAEAHFNLGVLLQYQGRLDAAREAYERAVAARPDYGQALNNLGAVLAAAGEWDRAADCYKRSLEALPDSPETLNNLGNLLKVQGRLAEAAVCYERTLKLAPDYPQVRYNWGLMLLAHGNFAEGWPHYEWRLRAMEGEQRHFDQPRWNGRSTTATVLVYAEQGFGDTIQFVRYLPQVAERARRVVCEVQGALIPLLAQSDVAANVEFVPRGKTLPQFDAQIPLLSLPAVFNTTAESVPLAEGYLRADRQLAARWREKLGEREMFRIGIAWQGSANYPGDRERSIPLVEFAPLALPGVELVSLQKGFGSEQIEQLEGRFSVRELGPEFDSTGGAFLDAAAVIENLDLVITSDTAIAHLAGALGKPTWVALSLVPDWRWMLERAESPWYASMRLFRQAELRAWPEVFRRMAAELRDLLAKR